VYLTKQLKAFFLVIHSLFDSIWEIIKSCLLPLVHFGFHLIGTLQHFVNLLPCDPGIEEGNALNSSFPTDCRVCLAIRHSVWSLRPQIYTSLDHWGTLKVNSCSAHDVRAEVCWTVLTLSPNFACAGVMYGVSFEDMMHFDEQLCGEIGGVCVCVWGFFLRLRVELKDDCNTHSDYTYWTAFVFLPLVQGYVLNTK